MDTDDVWGRYFDAKEDIVFSNGDVFRTYRAGSQGPHIVLLHGGGYTSMTWCLVTALLKEHFTVHALDFRGHGATRTSNDDDLSIDTLVGDVVAVLERILPVDDASTDRLQTTQTVIAGHRCVLRDELREQPTVCRGLLTWAGADSLFRVVRSLGGAVAVRVAATGHVKSLVGVMVVDVVEGTAIASLEHMHRILAKRPQSFNSCDEAVQWALHTGTVRNGDAAAVSVPSQLAPRSDGKFKWRTDLQHSASYWRGWFAGLSEQFLSLEAAKILVLAGSDRLDTALMRGQMMGKFELRLLYGSGHAIQEDIPDQLAKALLEFCGRCARAANCNLFGLQGSASDMPSPTDVLAGRLARARNMMPQPAVMPGRPSV